VREKRGLAYSVYSFAASYADAGLVGLYAGCSPKRAGTVAELLVAEFQRMASDGITDEELARAQGQLGGASALALEDSDTRMTRLGRSELTFGEFSDLDETLRRIGEVTATDVKTLAAELVERPLSVAAVGSIPSGALDGVADTAAAGAA
jgi:predicted Zn-dependent peptidase